MMILWLAISFIAIMALLMESERLCRTLSASLPSGWESCVCLLPLMENTWILELLSLLSFGFIRTLILCFHTLSSHFIMNMDSLAFINRHLFTIQKRIKIPCAA